MSFTRHILPLLCAAILAACSDTLPVTPIEENTSAQGARLILTVEPYGLPSLSSASRDGLYSAANEKETPQSNEQEIKDAVLIIYPYSLNDAEHLSAKVTDAIYFTFPNTYETIGSLRKYTSNTLNISGGYDENTEYYCFAIANAGDITGEVKNLTLTQLYNYVLKKAPYTAGANIQGFSNFVMSSVDEDLLKFHRMGDGTFKFVTHYNESTSTWEEKPIKVQRLASRVEFSFGGLESAIYSDATGYGFVYGNGFLNASGTFNATYYYERNILYSFAEVQSALASGEKYTLKFKVKGNSAQTDAITLCFNFKDSSDADQNKWMDGINVTTDWVEQTLTFGNDDYKLTSFNLLLGLYKGTSLDFDDFVLTRSTAPTTNIVTNGDFQNDLASWSNYGSTYFSITRSTTNAVSGTFTGKGIIYPVINNDNNGFTADKFLLTKVSIGNVVVPTYAQGGGTYAILHRANNIVEGIPSGPEVFGLVGFDSNGYPKSWAYSPTPTPSGAQDVYTDFSWEDGHAIDFADIVDNSKFTLEGTAVTFDDSNYFTSYYTGDYTTLHNTNQYKYPKTSAKYYLMDYLQENLPSTQTYTYVKIEGQYLSGGLGGTPVTILPQTLFLRHYANATAPSADVMMYGVVRNTIYRLSFRVYSNTKNASIRWYYYAGETSSGNGSGLNAIETDYWPTDGDLNGKPNPGTQGTHEVTIYEAVNSNPPAND